MRVLTIAQPTTLGAVALQEQAPTYALKSLKCIGIAQVIADART
jgi:hypothetical protein